MLGMGPGLVPCALETSGFTQHSMPHEASEPASMIVSISGASPFKTIKSGPESQVPGSPNTSVALTTTNKYPQGLENSPQTPQTLPPLPGKEEKEQGADRRVLLAFPPGSGSR